MSGMRLRYDGPADGWKQGLPLGNGRLGAVAYGGHERETWCVTEITYWSGRSEPSPTPSRGRADLDAMRERFFAGDYAGGEEMASRLLQAEKGNFGTNLSLCDVRLSFGAGANAAGGAGAGGADDGGSALGSAGGAARAGGAQADAVGG
ncbi:glycoside hydrolase N-terminal domain-containing protein, partial [Paenibacillus sp. MWE-103]|nr:glycoside hydrolase N-terminal domain-containing protein [Paenibacillus artemisiicola]